MNLKDILKGANEENLYLFAKKYGYEVNKWYDGLYDLYKGFPDKGFIYKDDKIDEHQAGRKITVSFPENKITIERYMRRGKRWSSRAGSINDDWNIWQYSDKYLTFKIRKV
ncbi:MAG: hypothetical protein KDD03_13275 [Gelidibacter sp.]|nr:hypothetical protein [Gelidibacter sp.]